MQGEQKALVDADKLSMVTGLYLRHADELRRLIIGVVGNRSLADDVLQTAFAKAIEHGGPDRQESGKAWLFRVAVNEALAVRRRQRVAGRARVEWALRAGSTADLTADDPLVRGEAIRAIRAALDELPAAQREIVRARVYEGKRFAEIAADMKLPLGTVLTRMRRALERLRKALSDWDWEP